MRKVRATTWALIPKLINEQVAEEDSKNLFSLPSRDYCRKPSNIRLVFSHIVNCYIRKNDRGVYRFLAENPVSLLHRNEYGRMD